MMGSRAWGQGGREFAERTFLVLLSHPLWASPTVSSDRLALGPPFRFCMLLGP